jgi:hypothetical protein
MFFFIVGIIIFFFLSFEQIYFNEELILGICLLFFFFVGIRILAGYSINNSNSFFIEIYSYYFYLVCCLRVLRAEILEVLFLVELIFEFNFILRNFLFEYWQVLGKSGQNIINGLIGQIG